MYVCVQFVFLLIYFFLFFFFKQKTAYEMRISDWSSDVCSSDLLMRRIGAFEGMRQHQQVDTLGFERQRVGACHDASLPMRGLLGGEIGRASCRERVCQYV